MRLSYIFLSKADNACGKRKDGILILQKNVTQQYHREEAFLFSQVQLKSLLFSVHPNINFKPHIHNRMIRSYLYMQHFETLT